MGLCGTDDCNRVRDYGDGPDDDVSHYRDLGRRSVVVVAMAALLSMGAAIMLYEIFPALMQAQASGFFHVSRICN